jgi:deoxyadenosine/deoxycytidine kinase
MSSTFPTFPILISLDGNIGAGKSTLLQHIEEQIPEVTVVKEPVGAWTSLKNQKGENLLELFYRDTSRWCYTFQNCAILTRLMDTQRILKEWKPSVGKLPIIITERSVLTDRHVFAEMLHREGKMDDLEWDLYMMWFNHFAKDLPVKGIIHLTTSAETSNERIHIRGRSGEERIPMEYLHQLQDQHKQWIAGSDRPILEVSTEPGVPLETTLNQIRSWILQIFTGTIQTASTEDLETLKDRHVDM